MTRTLGIAIAIVLGVVASGSPVARQCNGSLGYSVYQEDYSAACVPEIWHAVQWRATATMNCPEVGFGLQLSDHHKDWADTAEGVCSVDPAWICTYVGPYGQAYMNSSGWLEVYWDKKNGVRDYQANECTLTNLISDTDVDFEISECGGGGACCAGAADCINRGDRWFDYDCRCAPSPLFVLLQGAWDTALTSARRGVPFVMRPGLPPNLVAWTRAESQRVALLARDRNGNGTIDDASELYGGSTPQLTLAGRQRHGFTALATEDADGDGWVDARDPAFELMVFWFDLNHDGISQPREMVGVLDAGVTKVRVGYEPFEKDDRNGNTVCLRQRSLRTEEHAAGPLSPLRRVSQDGSLRIRRSKVMIGALGELEIGRRSEDCE